MATPPRSIASLTISFGLVAIPVKLYSATVSSERLSFNLLRQKDGSRVKQQYIAVNDGQVVERSEMVKGYEFAKGQYVIDVYKRQAQSGGNQPGAAQSHVPGFSVSMRVLRRWRRCAGLCGEGRIHDNADGGTAKVRARRERSSRCEYRGNRLLLRNPLHGT